MLKSLSEKTGYGRNSMEMSRGIYVHFRSGKYSNAAESYATQENHAYTIRNTLTEAAEFRVKTASLRVRCVLRAQKF